MILVKFKKDYTVPIHVLDDRFMDDVFIFRKNRIYNACIKDDNKRLTLEVFNADESVKIKLNNFDMKEYVDLTTTQLGGTLS